MKKIWVADSDYVDYQDCIDNNCKLGFMNDECVEFILDGDEFVPDKFVFDINSEYVFGYAERT